MRRVLALIALLLASCSGSAATTTTTTTAPETQTTPPTIPADLLTEEVVEPLGFALLRPVDWVPQIEADNGVAAFYSPPLPDDPFVENFNVIRTEVPADLDFETYVQNDARNLAASTGIEIVDSGLIQLGGEQAATVRFRTIVDGVAIGVVRAITLHDGAAYEYSFFVSEEEIDRWLPIIEQLLNSFRFLD